ncbi:hypothetical protein [Flavobacterium macrobrachii]|jgi:hypothetical protein|uniref:hypothetical protein n=1 Tax=Flavobacterium macrobrachii TaxID=591204 RepID=UPI0037BF17C7
MKKLKFAKIFFIVLTSVTLLTSCDAEKELISKSNRNIKKGNSEISFNDFKRETNLDDFKTNIKLSSQNYLARTADGTYEMSDFDVDIDVIKRLELDNDISYTFRIYPKVIVTPNSFYNLTLHNKDGVWVENIVEFKPTIENFDSLLSGETQELDGKASIIYTSDLSSLKTENDCYMVEIIGNNCESTNTLSDECAIKKHSTFCFNQDNIILGSESDIYNNTQVFNADYSFLLNTNDILDNLKEFMNNHILISENISKLIDDEENLDKEKFQNIQTTQFNSENEIRQALIDAGIVKSDELILLVKQQISNFEEFVLKNPDFQILKTETKEQLLNEVFNSISPEESNSNLARRTCAQQYNVDKDRCNRNTNRNGIFAMAACALSGPLGCFFASMALIAESSHCLQDARDDYYDCTH